MEYTLFVKYQTNDSWTSLDVYDDTAVKVVYNVQDVREPQSIKSNYTETFRIPGTRTNRQFFETLDQGGFTSKAFSPNLKVSAQLLTNEDVLIEGYLQVSEIFREDSSELQEFEVIIYGELSSLFSDISGMDFTSIDVSEYNHKLLSSNIKASWTNDVYKYGILGRREIGDGYVYPMEYRGQQLINKEERWSEQDFKPAFYVKTLWDKIFKKAGKTYTSSFLNTERFKRLIIPFSKDNLYLSEEQIKEKEFRVQRNNYQTTAGYTPILNAAKAETSSYVYVNFDTEINDPKDVFIAGTTFKPFQTFTGTLYCNFRVRAKYDASGVGPGGIFKLVNDKNNTGAFPLNIRIWDLTASPQTIIYDKTFNYLIGFENRLGSPSYDTDQNFFIECPGIFVKGHKYVIKYAATMPVGGGGQGSTKFVNLTGQYIGGTVTFQHSPQTSSNNPSDLYFVLNNKFIGIEDNINMNLVLPEMDLDKFLISINNMFNLYWYPNPDRQNDFIIEPKDDIYGRSVNKILDWTYKADRDETISIRPLDEINFNKYVFTYKEDGDKYNTDYQNQYGEIYGQRTIEVVNDFKTDTNLVELEFSPTPGMVYRDGKVIPSYIQEDSNLVLSPFDPNVRILYWGGMINKEVSNLNSWYLMADGLKYYQSSTIYPYAGHLDNPFNPNFDLNWGLCKQYFHNTPSLTSNNLFNVYWKNTINDILSIDNHLLTMTAHFTPYDFYVFNIFDTIQMDEVYYRINKVEYDIITEIAKVELYKVTNVSINNYVAPTIITPPSPITTGTGTGGGGGWPTPNPGTGTWKPGGWNNWGNYGNDAWTTIRDTWSTGSKSSFYNVMDSEWGNYETVRTNVRTNNQLGYTTNLNSSQVNSVVTTDFRNNLYYRNQGIVINGANNVVRDAYNISVIGNNNVVSDSASNIKILGDTNFVATNVKNVEVFGDNNYVSRSDATYRDGIVTVNNKTMFPGTVFRGGINTVGNPFGTTPPVIRAGVNAVENFGGCKDVQVIRGGINNTLFNDY